MISIFSLSQIYFVSQNRISRALLTGTIWKKLNTHQSQSEPTEEVKTPSLKLQNTCILSIMLKFSSIMYLTLIYCVETTLCPRNHNPLSAKPFLFSLSLGNSKWRWNTFRRLESTRKRDCCGNSRKFSDCRAFIVFFKTLPGCRTYSHSVLITVLLRVEVIVKKFGLTPCFYSWMAAFRELCLEALTSLLLKLKANRREKSHRFNFFLVEGLIVAYR